MPTMSYVAFATKGQKDKLVCSARKIKGCEVYPSQDDQDLVVIVSQCDDEPTNKLIFETLNQLPEIQNLSLCFASEE